MLANSYSLTYNAEAVVLNKINQDSNGSAYFAKLGNDRDVTMTVKHTFPRNRLAKGVESHLVRFDISYYNTVDGTLLRTNSAWKVLQVKDGIQLDADLKATDELLNEIMAVSGFLDAILARRS